MLMIVKTKYLQQARERSKELEQEKQQLQQQLSQQSVAHHELQQANTRSQEQVQQLQEQVSDILNIGHYIIVIQWHFLSYSECLHSVIPQLIYCIIVIDIAPPSLPSSSATIMLHTHTHTHTTHTHTHTHREGRIQHRSL